MDSERENNRAVKLPDGGYFGSLHVYHELHCIVSRNDCPNPVPLLFAALSRTNKIST